MQYELKKMSIGEILDTSIKVFRDNVLALLGIAITVQAISFGVLMILTMTLIPGLQESGGVFGLLAVLIPLMITLAIMAPLATAMSTKIVADRYLGRSVSMASAFKTGLKLIIPLFLALLISSIFTMIGFLLLGIPGLYLLIKYSLIAPAVVVEQKGGMVAMGRSWELTSKSKMKIGVLFLLSIIAAGMVQGTIIGLLGQTVVADLLVQLVGAIIGSFFSVVWTITYFERRCEKEGFDMLILAQSFDE